MDTSLPIPLDDAGPPVSDLELGFVQAREACETLRGACLLITGGTGFVGLNLVKLLLHADRSLELGLRLTLVTRDPEAFQRREPGLVSDPRLELLEGDVRGFAPPSAQVSHVIHAAAETNARWNATCPQEAVSTIVDGTRHVLDIVRRCRAKRMLFVSSGAVYGKQPPALARIPETYGGGPDPLDPGAAYGEAKRLAEHLCAIEATSGEVKIPVARLFAFVGPHLPLDEHFAVGNFIGDALAGRMIRVTGDGTPRRSYLYSAELAAWLIVLLAQGRNTVAYNVGSEVDVSIREMAETVSLVVAPGCGIEFGAQEVPGRLPERYVPDTTRMRTEFGLSPRLDLVEAIRRTADWWRRR